MLRPFTGSLLLSVFLLPWITACSNLPADSDPSQQQATLQLPFEARGNEPPWLLTIDDSGLLLSRGYDRQEIRYAPIRQQQDSEQLRMTAGERSKVTALLNPAVCHDSMTAMPYPWQVSVITDGESLQGCGGDPRELLLGEWIIEDINGKGIIDSSRISLHMDAEGRFSGLASCNRYAGSYQLSGEGIHFGQTLATKMACAPALMQQEQRFFSILNNISRFDRDATGALILSSHDGKTLRGYLLGQ
ncbi:MAG: META domain-containing protein [Marinospirillum sp.]|uniref:META domain-containing protein n=1 Tax=Marinospirillum sp. TaxID=2183934 RepID=UPI0019E5D726|nr:META domain-containing protein [Marinospirillum sp.]MBE0506805.1 META domain-containing protein [Marinospirillum sp.]